MLKIMSELIILLGITCALIVALIIIFFAIASYIITRDNIEYEKAVKEFEENEGDGNEHNPE